MQDKRENKVCPNKRYTNWICTENPKATRRLIKHKGIGGNGNKEQMGLYQGTKKIVQMRQDH